MKPISKIYLAPFAIIAALAITTCSLADDWPHWRGPNRNDKSSETDLLERWPTGGPKQLWVNQKSGLGYSGFAIVKGRLFTLGLEDGKEFGLCLDADSGKELWRTNIGPQFQNSWGDGPRSTPSVSGDRVYFMTAAGHVACLKVGDGAEVWNVKMSDFGGEVPTWGYAESPLVDGDQVVCTPGGKKNTIVALNKNTGKVIWKSEPITRVLDSGKKTSPAVAHYSSILPVVHDGKKQYVQLTVLAVVGVDAATGKTLWQVPFPGRVAVIPSPIYDEGSVYVTAGYGAGSKLIKLGDNNEWSETWFTKGMQNHHGTAIKVGDYFYGSSAKAFACQSAEDGEPVWSERRIKKGALSYADGLFYHVQENDGKVLLFAASPEGKIEARGSFILAPQSKRRNRKGAVWVHPVISNGKLYLRDQEFIHCYDIKDTK